MRLIKQEVLNYEVELYRELIKKLNSLGFQFEDSSKQRGHADLIDSINRVIVEVKLGIDCAEDGASQVLYEMGREKLTDFLYVGLADSELFHVFKSPEYGDILTFATELDKDLKDPPSKFSGKKIAEALVLLGKPIWQDFWKDTTHDIQKILDGTAMLPFIAVNLFGWHRIFGLYKIKTTDIIAAFTDFDVVNVKVTKNRLIITRSKGDPISIKYKGTMMLTHKWMMERLRIPDIAALEELRQTSDRLQTDEQRAKRGAYYTEQFLSIEMGNKALQCVKPDFVVEPYAGAGSLLIPFVNKGFVKGWVNDYDEGAAGMLAADYGSVGYIVTCADMIDFSMSEVLEMIGDAKEPLFITNPPFSSSRGRQIQYGGLDKIYGKGNQIFPTIGKIVQIMKRLERGHLAFFSPFTLFCGRDKYQKLYNQLMENFKFVQGFVWSGKHFNDVSNVVPVAFSIWKFGGKTSLDELVFECENIGPVKFGFATFLKDAWSYHTEKRIRGEIAVQQNSYFNHPAIKVINLEVEKGGSELLLDNVRIDLGVSRVPSELIYGIWSILVGTNAIIRHPFSHHVSYVHLPDFSNPTTIEILAYGLLYGFAFRHYAGEKIGFVGARKIMKFGDSQRLNDGARYLFRTYGDLPVGEQTISEVLEALKKGKEQDNWKSDIHKEISDRLNAIGYWDYIPLPLREDSEQESLE